MRFSSHTLDKHTKNIEIFNNIHGYKLERFPTYRNYLEAGGHIPFSCWAIIIKKELLIDNEIEFDISKTISEDVIWNLTVAKKLGDRSYFSTNLNVVKYMVNINSAINSDDISKNLRHLESSLAYHESLTIDFADTAYLTKVVDIYRHTCLRQIITRFLSCKFSPSLNDEKRIEVRRVINEEKDKGGLIKFFLIISKSNWTFLPVQFLYRNIFIPFVKPFLRRN